MTLYYKLKKMSSVYSYFPFDIKKVCQKHSKSMSKTEQNYVKQKSRKTEKNPYISMIF